MCSAFRSAAILALVLLATDAAARDLRVCADPNNLPFSNARLEGLENKLVDILAEELHAHVTYTWWAQRRGFIRNTLNAGLCDLVPGTAAGLEMLQTTKPYYRSTYVFVTRADGPQVASLDDPALRTLRIGVPLIGDDGANPPPAHALARRGIVANVRGYSIYGDYRQSDPPARIVEAVAAGEIDVAIAWGPLAGYFAPRQAVPLRIAPVLPMREAELPMTFAVALGVRRGEDALRDEIETALTRRRADIDALLAAYGVPRAENAAREPEP